MSLRIRTLEAELGQPLFERVGRRVVPTAPASAMAARVQDALAGIADALDAFQAATPRLRLTAPPTFASRWLAPRLARYPQAANIEIDVSADVRDSHAFDVAIRTGCGGWPEFEEFRLTPVDATPMLAPSLLQGQTLEHPGALADFDLLPHPDWPRWFAEAQCNVPEGLRFASVDYPTHELDANAAVAGLGVALLSPSLFEPLLMSGQLVAPFACVLGGPDWHFALIRQNDARPGPRQLCAWLRDQAQQSA